MFLTGNRQIKTDPESDSATQEFYKDEVKLLPLALHHSSKCLQQE